MLEAVLLQFWFLDLFGLLHVLISERLMLPQADTSDLLCRQPCHAHDAVPVLEWISLTRLADSFEDICWLPTIVKGHSSALGLALLLFDFEWWFWVIILPFCFRGFSLLSLTSFFCEWIGGWNYLFDVRWPLHLLSLHFHLLTLVFLKLDRVHEFDGVPCLLLQCYTFVWTHGSGH